MSVNKPIVAKTKAILKEYGYEVKTAHIYEMFAKLSGEKNWNVANVKSVSFLNVLKDITENTVSKKSFNGDYIQKLLSENNLVDRLYLGDFVETGKPNIVNNLSEPGVIFYGKVGIGKTTSLLTTLILHLLSNWRHSSVFLIDPKLGVLGNSPLFDPQYYNLKPGERRPFEQVHAFHSGAESLIQAIDLAYEEMETRKALFHAIKAESPADYDEKVKDEKNLLALKKQFPGVKIPKKTTRLLLAFEGFSDVVDMIDFHRYEDREGTSAHKLKTICKIGRGLGITPLISSQRASFEDVPSFFKAAIATPLVFKVNIVDASTLSQEKAAEIRGDQKGFCYCEKGAVQFPHLFSNEGIDQREIASFLKNSIGALESDFAFLTTSKIEETLSESGGLARIKQKLTLEVDSRGYYEYQPLSVSKADLLNAEELSRLIKLADSKKMTVKKKGSSLLFTRMSEDEGSNLIDQALGMAKVKTKEAT